MAVFRKLKGNSRRYMTVKFRVNTLPSDSRPVRVIESSTYVVLLQEATKKQN